MSNFFSCNHTKKANVLNSHFHLLPILTANPSCAPSHICLTQTGQNKSMTYPRNGRGHGQLSIITSLHISSLFTQHAPPLIGNSTPTRQTTCCIAVQVQLFMSIATQLLPIRSAASHKTKHSSQH